MRRHFAEHAADANETSVNFMMDRTSMQASRAQRIQAETWL
jgi:hypothetical protein